MQRIVLSLEHILELLLENLSCQAESLSSQAVKPQVRPLLHTTLKQHVAQFVVLVLSEVHLQKLMAAVLEVNRTHYNQINAPPQIYEVLLGHVVDLGLLVLRVRF